MWSCPSLWTGALVKWILLQVSLQHEILLKKTVFVILLSIFALTPAPIRAHSRSYPRSLLRLSAPIRAYSRTLPLMLMHKYWRENDKSQENYMYLKALKDPELQIHDWCYCWNLVVTRWWSTHAVLLYQNWNNFTRKIYVFECSMKTACNWSGYAGKGRQLDNWQSVVGGSVM